MMWFEKWRVTEIGIDPIAPWTLKRLKGAVGGWAVWHYDKDTNSSYGLQRMAKAWIEKRTGKKNIRWVVSKIELGLWSICRCRCTNEIVLWAVYFEGKHQETCKSLRAAKDYVKNRIKLSHVHGF